MQNFCKGGASVFPIKPFLFSCLLAVGLTLSPAAFGTTVNLNWKASTSADVAGYRVHYGRSSGNYTTDVDVGNHTSCSLSGLQEGITYYFAATAYNSSQAVSDYSGEVSYKIPANSTSSSTSSGTTSGLTSTSSSASDMSPGSSTDNSSSPAGGTYISAPNSSRNVLKNADFENGTNHWNFYTNGTGTFTVTDAGNQNTKIAVVTTNTNGTNIQLYQYGIPLEPNKTYQLNFSAFSNTGHDMKVSLIKQVAPYTNYGLSFVVANLATNWQSYTFNLTTKNFSSLVNDARLMFWLANDAAPGDRFYIDDVELIPID